MGYESAMVSAMLIRDAVCGIENPYAQVFSPLRFSGEEVPQLMKDGGKAVKGLTKRFFHVPSETISSVERGHGAIVETPQGKAGVYKTEEGTVCQGKVRILPALWGCGADLESRCRTLGIVPVMAHVLTVRGNF